MAAISERKIEIVRTLVENAPDRVVGGLQQALADTAGDPVLAAVRKLVEAEAHDRRVRNMVLEPVAPMCVGDGAAASRLTFPARALALAWRGLKAQLPAEVEAAALLLSDFRPGESPPESFDLLAASVAEGLRLREGLAYRQAAELCDAGRPDGAAAFCACLDLVPLTRGATLRLGDWISRTNDENTAAIRVIYKDAVELAEDAGPRFFEMLAAQLAQPWRVLRIISAEMDRPSDKYLAASELASFALRLMDEVDDNLLAVSRLDLDGGESAGRALGRIVETVTQQIAELEQCVDIGREGAWGNRIARQKKALAGIVEGHLRTAEKVATDALPAQPVRIGKITRAVPVVVAEPNAQTVGRAMTLLHFSHEIRTSANYGGFASTRTKVAEKIGEMIDKYVEELLDRIRVADVDDDLAHLFLGVAADFSALIRDDKAAEIIRRRAAAAVAAERIVAASA